MRAPLPGPSLPGSRRRGTRTGPRSCAGAARRGSTDARRPASRTPGPRCGAARTAILAGDRAPFGPRGGRSGSAGSSTAASEPSVDSGQGGVSPAASAEQRPCPARQRVVPGPHLVPSARHEAADEVDGPGDAERRRGIAGPRPVELEPEPGTVRAWRVGTMAHDQRTDAGLAVTANVEERRALRSAEPLVAVAGVVSRAEPREVDRQHARGVRAVDQHVHAPRLQRRDQRLDREHHAGRAGHVVEKDEPGPSGDGAEHRVRHVDRTAEREGHLGHHHLCPGTLGHGTERVGAGIVGVVRGEQLVSGPEDEGAQDGVHPGGGVVDQREVVRIGSKEGPEPSASLVEQRLDRPDEEVDGIALHPCPELGLQREHLARAGAERAMVQEGDARIQRPVGGERRRRRAPHRPGPSPAGVRSGRSKVRCVSSNPRLR